MAAITVSDVQDAVDPNITRVSNTWLTWVNTKVSVDSFDGEDGVHTKLVRCYLYAHFISLDPLGALTGATEGGISRQYAAPIMSSESLQRTTYGAAALGLIRMYVGGGLIAQ